MISIKHRPAISSQCRCGNSRSARRKLVVCSSNHDTSDARTKRIFIFGLGYTTLCLANTLSCQGWHITGTLRSNASLEALQQLKPKWDLLLFDPCNEPGKASDNVQSRLEDASHIITSIPPVGLPLYDPVLRAQLKAVKAAGNSDANSRLQWLGYLSSTGVYGDYRGDWVDERSECRSVSSRGYLRHQHELAWGAAALQAGLPLHIFRLGGIYGPGRSLLSSGNMTATDQGLGRRVPRHVRKSEQTAADNAIQGQDENGSSSSKRRRAQQKYISRVHVLDICTALAASMHRPSVSRAAAATSKQHLNPSGPVHATVLGDPQAVAIFNIVDDEPASRQEVLQYTRSLLGLEEQSSTVSTSSQSTSSAVTGSDNIANSNYTQDVEEKRVRNAKLKQELGVSLKFPTYREGMASIVAGDLAPFTIDDLTWLKLQP